MTYVFKFRRWIFWQKFTVIGHGYIADQDKMALYTVEGIREIKKWKQCEANLGSDWKLIQQKRMEEEAAQKVPLKV